MLGIRRSGRVLAGVVLVTASASFVSCGASELAVLDPDEVGSVAVTAPVTSLSVGESVQLEGTVRDIAGAPLTGASLTWSSASPTVASVSDAGLAEAVGPGMASISASVGGVSGSVVLTVSTVMPSPATSVVSVSSPTTQVGQAVGLQLVAKDSGGGTIRTGGAAVAFTATGGTSAGQVSSSTDNADGTYSAVFTATAAGSPTTIGATLNGVAVTTTLPTLTVSDPPPNAAVIFEDDFETQNLASWDQVETSGGKFTITTEPENVRDGAAALRITLNASTGTAGAINKWFMPGYEEVWLVMDVKVDPSLTETGHFAGLQGHRTDNQYSAYGQAGVRPDGQDFFQSMMDPGWAARPGWYLYSYWMEMQCSGSPCYGNNILQDAPRISHDGGWQRFVRRIRVNTVGQADGLEELWIDGDRKILRSSVRFRDTAELLVNDLALFAYFPGLTGTHYVYVDNVQVRSSPPPGFD